MDFEQVKIYYKTNPLPNCYNFNNLFFTLMQNHLELQQLEDWRFRYSEEPINQSKQYMDTYNYNKELDTKRTNFNEQEMKDNIISCLCDFMWQLLALSLTQNPEINFVTLNTMLTDSKTARVERHPMLLNAALSVFKGNFSLAGDFIPKSIDLRILTQILSTIISICIQLNIDFKKGWEMFAYKIDKK